MPEQTQTINASATRIVPIQLKPPADILIVVPGRTSTINYAVGQLIPGIPGKPEIPGKVGRGQILESGQPGQPGYQPYVPAILGSPTIPAVPPVQDSIAIIDQGSIEMTDAEWDAWDTKNDNEYRTAIVAARLGLTTTGVFVPVK